MSVGWWLSLSEGDGDGGVYIVKMLTLLVFMLLVWSVDHILPETECSFSPGTASLECRVHVYSVYSASLASADRARNIKIVCSHEQADQPVIEQNQFVQSHNLSKLEIERCSQLQIRRGAWQGLHNLHTLKVWSWQQLIQNF